MLYSLTLSPALQGMGQRNNWDGYGGGCGALILVEDGAPGQGQVYTVLRVHGARSQNHPSAA
jgi:hypothetical protein